MSRVTVRNLPRLHLSHLLRRRKTTLQRFVNESGIQTYSSLVLHCDRLGVQAPEQREYEVVFPNIVTSPADGVVVLEPIPVIDDLTGRPIDPDAPVSFPGVEAVFEAQEPQSDDLTEGRRRRRKPASQLR